MDSNSKGISLPLIHEHPMIPWNDLRRGNCCGHFQSISDGYYCKSCDFFFHKKCFESSESIQHPSHSIHTLYLRSKSFNKDCDLCGISIVKLFYRCDICDFIMDPHCAMHPPPDVLENSEKHGHKLTLSKSPTEFDCAANCGKTGYQEAYKCHECNLTFHVYCVWPTLENAQQLNHSYHPLHPLKLLINRPPDYSDGKCRLCERDVDKYFYHCSFCNFTLDMCCILNPPTQSLVDLKAHDHQLTLLPRLDSFTCNACGLKGNRSPYVCFICGFMIHQKCLDLPRVININRHDHRVYRTSVIGVVNSVCRVCHKKVDWIWGAYYCQKCPEPYVVHSKCATRKDVWNGIELEGVPEEEEEEDIDPYVVIDENTILHFGHKEHYLRLNLKSTHGLVYEDNTYCNACTQQVGLQSFYGCVMDCGFNLHQKCADLPKKKRHVLHNDKLTLVTSKVNCSQCEGCSNRFNGFVYEHKNKELDMRCASVSEPFIHPSHPQHPLYYIPCEMRERCNGCRELQPYLLECIEEGCEFVLGFECATLPQVVKHSFDDHPLTLCHGEKASSDAKYWCKICEKQIDPEEWFYTCKDQLATLHRMCVLGRDSTRFMPRSILQIKDKSFEVLLNNTMSRPFCSRCKFRCTSPVVFKSLGASDHYFCTWFCVYWYYVYEF